MVKWMAPEEGWLKLNIDGACDPISNSIAVGGIIRDQFGNWIICFQNFLGQGNSLLTECWGVLLGINLALSIDATNIWIESDCANLVNLLTDQSMNPLHHLAPIILSCQSSLSHFSSFKISHVLREGNQCADALAGHALISHSNFISHHSCPPFAVIAYTMNRLGIHTPRGID